MKTLNAHCYIRSPAVFMRASPTHTAEVVSQGYFSEPVTIKQTEGSWAQIETQIDGYLGWIDSHEHLVKREATYPNKNTSVVIVDRCAALLYQHPDTIYGPILTLPFESILEISESEFTKNQRWIAVKTPDGTSGYIQAGDIREPNLVKKEALIPLSFRFLGLPYIWGGRTSFGYDCSGFVQMLYRQMGIYLPRDSKDQCQWEKFTEIPIEEVESVDLIFFGKTSEKISHVGMAIGNGQFIHACATTENMPYVRISDLNTHEWSGLGYYPYRTVRRLS